MPRYRVTQPLTRLYEAPDDAGREYYQSHGTELLYGEIFDGQDTEDSWVYGASLTDGYQGWAAETALQAIENEISGAGGTAYKIRVPLAPVYTKPHLKSTVLSRIPFEGRIALEESREENGYIFVTDLDGWLHRDHVRAADNKRMPANEAKQVTTCLTQAAQTFLHAPYVYGGRSALGVDCSALVQLSFAAADILVPRDSTPQAQAMTNLPLSADMAIRAVDVNTALQSGDIIFLPGHVGLMLDERRFLHASSRLMRVVIEDIDDVARYYTLREGQGITGIRRIVMC